MQDHTRYIVTYGKPNLKGKVLKSQDGFLTINNTKVTLYDETGKRRVESKRLNMREAEEVAAIEVGEEYAMSKSCKVYIDSIDTSNNNGDGDDGDDGDEADDGMIRPFRSQNRKKSSKHRKPMIIDDDDEDDMVNTKEDSNPFRSGRSLLPGQHQQQQQQHHQAKNASSSNNFSRSRFTRPKRVMLHPHLHRQANTSANSTLPAYDNTRVDPPSHATVPHTVPQDLSSGNMKSGYGMSSYEPQEILRQTSSLNAQQSVGTTLTGQPPITSVRPQQLPVTPVQPQPTIVRTLFDSTNDQVDDDGNEDDDEDDGVIRPSKPRKSSDTTSSPPLSRSTNVQTMCTPPNGQRIMHNNSNNSLNKSVSRMPRPRFTAPSNSSKTSSVSNNQYRSTIPNKIPNHIQPAPNSLPQKELPDVLSLVINVASTRHSIIFPDSAICDMFMVGNRNPNRKILIPDNFSTMHHYRSTFLNAVYEGSYHPFSGSMVCMITHLQGQIPSEMNLQMFDAAFQFRRHYAHITDKGDRSSANTMPLCRCKQKAKLVFVKKSGPNKGRPFFSCAKSREKGCSFFDWADKINHNGNTFISPTYSAMVQCVDNIVDSRQRQSHFRKNNVHYHVDCELIRSLPNSPSKHKRRRRSSYKDEYGDNNSSGGGSQSGKVQWYLKLGEKEKSTTAYSKDDVWIISTSDDFNPRDGEGSVIVCKSLSHGPSSNDLISISIISGKPKNVATQDVYAIRGPNFSTEFEIINNLQDLESTNLPLLYELLGQSSTEYRKPPALTQGEIDFKLPLSTETIDLVAEQFVSDYELNGDQQQVIENCCAWLKGDRDSQNILLVHGVFGAGKSYLLVVLIMFICKLLDQAKNSDIKILVSSVTNVAVDNILYGLQRNGFYEFLRVGSQKKIAKTILPYTVSTDKNNKEMLRELRSMIKDPSLDQEELDAMKQQLEDLKSGAAENRKKQIKDVRVVGVTCAATTFEVLQGCHFPIIILDESSQCLEPLALLPISRFSCQKLIAVGDPLQLPPTILGNTGNKNEFTDSIEKTLFIRMTKTGLKPILLRTQYRCHPKISELSNKLFYSEKLIDGVSEINRPPLLPCLAPVSLIDCIGKEERADGSWYNDSEIRVIVHLCNMLVTANVPPEQIGIVTMYRTQRARLQNALLKESLKAVKISTVDAFQGGEKEIIFMSTVKASGDLSFIESNERLNVALTRARRHLIVVGKRLFLSKSRTWKFVIEQAASLNGIYSAAMVINSEDFSFLQELNASGGSARVSQPIAPIINSMPLSDYMSGLMNSYSPQRVKERALRRRPTIIDDDSSNNNDNDDEEKESNAREGEEEYAFGVDVGLNEEEQLSPAGSSSPKLEVDNKCVSQQELTNDALENVMHVEEEEYLFPGEDDERPSSLRSSSSPPPSLPPPSKKARLSGEQTPHAPLDENEHGLDVQVLIGSANRDAEKVHAPSQDQKLVDFGAHTPLQITDGMFDLDQAIKDQDEDMDEFGW